MTNSVAMQLTVLRRAIIYHKAPIGSLKMIDTIDNFVPETSTSKQLSMPIFPLKTFITIKGYSV